MSGAPTAWILQPYVPRYRTPFFSSLGDCLGRDGMRLRVIVPERPPRGTRADGEIVGVDWCIRAPVRRTSIAGKEVDLLRERIPAQPGDVVVTGLQGTLPETYRALLGARRRGIKVGVWGHVGSYTGVPHRLDTALEQWQMRRADRVFAYTPAGAELAQRSGARAVTTVMNSVDTSYLSRIDGGTAVAQLLGEEPPAGIVVGYVGALDASKRLGLLAEALEMLQADGAQVTVLVAGHGPDGQLLDAAVQRGQVRLLGYGDETTKAALAAVCSGFVMPGRIGLIAVETLAMGLPLVAPSWPFHAPEAEYLVEGESLISVPDSARGLADGILSLQGRTRQTWSYPTLEAMVANYAEGVLAMVRER